MGFSEGTEDEFLLTCFVCKEPFGMLAAFCGGCGARRDQAMGIERAKESQQISQNEIFTPSFTETFPSQSGTAFENPFFPGAQATPAPSNSGTASAAATTAGNANELNNAVLRAKLNNDKSDLRIIGIKPNGDSIEAPYILSLSEDSKKEIKWKLKTS